MKLYHIIGATPFLVACSLAGPSSEVTKCDEQILSKLKNPDSYARGQYDTLSLGDRWQVGIEFSYVDNSGKRVEQAWQTCDFPIKDGEPDTSTFVNLAGSLDAKEELRMN